MSFFEKLQAHFNRFSDVYFAGAILWAISTFFIGGGLYIAIAGPLLAAGSLGTALIIGGSLAIGIGFLFPPALGLFIMFQNFMTGGIRQIYDDFQSIKTRTKDYFIDIGNIFTNNPSYSSVPHSDMTSRVESVNTPNVIIPEENNESEVKTNEQRYEAIKRTLENLEEHKSPIIGKKAKELKQEMQAKYNKYKCPIMLTVMDEPVRGIVSQSSDSTTDLTHNAYEEKNLQDFFKDKEIKKDPMSDQIISGITKDKKLKNEIHDWLSSLEKNVGKLKKIVDDKLALLNYTIFGIKSNRDNRVDVNINETMRLFTRRKSL